MPVNVLVRPRGGDFLYTDKELRQCEQDTAYAVGAGADGVVFGALTSDGRVDEYACGKVLEAIRRSAAPGARVSTTFHRAFDLCRDPFVALETIISLVQECTNSMPRRSGRWKAGSFSAAMGSAWEAVGRMNICGSPPPLIL